MHVAKCAKKALSLRKDMVFRLLVIMTILLGMLCGAGAAAFKGLENVYASWKLEQESQMSVYLLSTTDDEQVSYLVSELQNVEGVEEVLRLETEDVSLLLEPYFIGEESFPLPIVLTVETLDDMKRDSFDSVVKNIVPDAEIDDARVLLTKVAEGVRFAKTTVLGVSVCAFVMMLLLVSLTVRAGLRGHRKSLAVMQYVGATNGFVTSLVVRQVVKQSLVGWVGAVLLVCSGIFLISWQLPDVAVFIDRDVYIYAVTAPFCLVVLTLLAAIITSRKVVENSGASLYHE
jgi:cell division protein FtsX